MASAPEERQGEGAEKARRGDEARVAVRSSTALLLLCPVAFFHYHAQIMWTVLAYFSLALIELAVIARAILRPHRDPLFRLGSGTPVPAPASISP